jgi:hypothetical protein
METLSSAEKQDASEQSSEFIKIRSTSNNKQNSKNLVSPPKLKGFFDLAKLNHKLAESSSRISDDDEDSNFDDIKQLKSSIEEKPNVK